MPEKYKYLIIGAGLAGASAVEGIREMDRDGKILLIGNEKHLPYDRPPLTKKLWFGKKKLEEIFLHDENFYKGKGAEFLKGKTIVSVDPSRKTAIDGDGREYAFYKLLLATGGVPRRLPPDIKIAGQGGDLEGICYYRYLDDYLEIRAKAKPGARAVIIGGGFIGSELAAALNINRVEVTMVFPEEYIVNRVFPEYLGRAVQQKFIEKGVKIHHDKPASFEKKGDEFLTRTEGGLELTSTILIAGIGIIPETGLAESAGLKIGNGVIVNEFLQTSNPDIYAAGDNAFFPYKFLEKEMRIEHWDNALAQGHQAGRNMAGAREPYDYMPYFFSDLFEFGYEAVGDVNASLRTIADWKKENEEGTIYYLRDGVVAGAMMCNIFGKVDAARELIKKKERIENLMGAIR
jgi:3-phenylpropionate/trans-cinnamate dioxygenase ferredoxin reductase subunit